MIKDIRLLQCGWGSKPSRHIAEITLTTGDVQRPTWRGLNRYWGYANPLEVEYTAKSFSGDKFVLCCSVASGQCGRFAVWNTSNRRWIQVTEANHISCGLLFEELNAVISFHYIAYWGVAGHHSILVTPLTGSKSAGEEDSILVPYEHNESGFNPHQYSITQAAYADYDTNDNGPVGIFYIKDSGVFYAHDARNLYTFTVDGLKEVLFAK
jgi:hypothetical protein